VENIYYVFCIGVTPAIKRLTPTLLVVSSNELPSSIFQSSPVIVRPFSTLVPTTIPQITNSVTTTTTVAATTTLIINATVHQQTTFTFSTVKLSTDGASHQTSENMYDHIWMFIMLILAIALHPLLIAGVFLFFTFIVVLLITIMLLVYWRKQYVHLKY